MKVNCNVLYYFEKGREYNKAINILEKLNIKYVPIEIHSRMIDTKFIHLLLEFCENGFEDLIKNQNKTTEKLDLDTMTTNQLIELIVEKQDEILKPVWFLGKNRILTSKMIEDDFTVHIPYNERELSKIYE